MPSFLNRSEVALQWKRLYQDMEDRLSAIQKEKFDTIEMIRLSVNECRTKVNELKKSIHIYTFASDEEEIFFFKEVKPTFCGALIYYMRLLRLEAERPDKSLKLWQPRLERVLERIQYFFDNNIALYRYYKSGSTYLDSIYFKRYSSNVSLELNELYFSYDDSFFTPQDLTLAKIIANERLFLYVSQCLSELNIETVEKTSDSAIILNWTATKVGLIELLYALQSAGVFNNGICDLKQLAFFFEQTFNIELGNYYNVFQEIRLRKKNRTIFLDQLKERLTKRMDEADDNGR